MKFLNKLIPSFLKRIDKYLLLNYPALWNLKLHFLLWFQLLVIAPCFGISYVFPHIHPLYTEPLWIPGFFTILLGVLSVAWLFLSHQFEIRKRHAGRPALWEMARMLSYAWACIALYYTAVFSLMIMSIETVEHFETMPQKSFERIEDYVLEFAEVHWRLANTKQTELAEHLKVPNHKLDLSKEELSEAELLIYFNHMALLNNKYGLDKNYTGHELLQLTRKSSYSLFNHSKGYDYYDGKYNDGALKTLSIKVYQAHNAYRYINSEFRALPWKSTKFYVYFLIVFGLFGCLIYYYKFFGIRGLIMGIVAPTVAYFIGGLIIMIGLLFFDESHFAAWPFDLTLGLVILALVLFSFKKPYSSNLRIGLYQSIPLGLAVLLAYIVAIRSEPDVAKMRYAEFHTITAAQFIILFFFTFLVTPLYQYGLYKLHLLPKK